MSDSTNFKEFTPLDMIVHLIHSCQIAPMEMRETERECVAWLEENINQIAEQNLPIAERMDIDRFLTYAKDVIECYFNPDKDPITKSTLAILGHVLNQNPDMATSLYDEIAKAGCHDPDEESAFDHILSLIDSQKPPALGIEMKL